MTEYARPHDLVPEPIHMEDFSLTGIGSDDCHWETTPAFLESMQGVERSTLIAIASSVQLARMSDLSGMRVWQYRGMSFSHELENSEGYQRQLFDLAKALQYYKDGGYVRISDSEFDITQGLIGEALFYAVARKVGAPVTITRMAEDYGGKGHDFEVVTPQGSRYLDITTIGDEGRRRKKFEPQRDATVFYIPLRDFSLRNPNTTKMIQHAVTDLFHTAIADTPEEGLQVISTGDIDYGRIHFDRLRQEFKLEWKDPTKVLFSKMLEYAQGYLTHHYENNWGFMEWTTEQQQEYERVMVPIKFLQQFAQE